MAGINKVILVGNLGQNPELRYTPNGVAVCSLRVATSESYTDRASGERITNTEWHNVVLWRGLAETAGKYLKTGSQVYLEGKLKTRQWQDQQGQNRYTTEVVADVMQLLGRAPGREDNAPQATAPAAASACRGATRATCGRKPECSSRHRRRPAFLNRNLLNGE